MKCGDNMNKKEDEKVYIIEENKENKKKNIPNRIILHISKDFDEVYSKAVAETIKTMLNPL